MNSIEVAYRQKLREQQTRDVNTFMDAPDPYPIETQKPETKPSAAEALPEKPGVVSTLTKTTVEAGSQAFKHFASGLSRVAQSSLDPNLSGVESLSGAGEGLLGGLTLMMALPAGIGAAAKRA